MTPDVVKEHKQHSSEISSVTWAICIHFPIQWEIHNKQKFAAVSPDFDLSAAACLQVSDLLLVLTDLPLTASYSFINIHFSFILSAAKIL